ncbi:MAG: FAD-dependent oxidoreductase [Tepidisphaeraceae bacterium]
MSAAVCLLLACLLLLFPGCAARREAFDVVVYGATPSGICAATAAARAGVRVALVEPMPLVGGMMSSGLSFSDSNQCDRRTLGGLFEEVHRRIEADYRRRGVTLPYDVSVKDHRSWTYEPHVAERVFNEMLRDAGVGVFLEHPVDAVTKRGNRIERMTAGLREFDARIFIDASYEGDLMAAAGVSYTVGREGRQRYGESLAGHQFPKPTLPFSPRDEGGRLLPLMTGETAGDDRGDGKLMTYSWRLCMTRDPKNRIPIAKPQTYDPDRFELARRLFQHAKDPSVVGLDLYPIPGNKVDVNNGIARQLSMGLVGASWDWPDATPAARQRIWAAHKDYALELIWFLKTDPAVPDKVRAALSEYGLAKDEFTSTSHWPPALYVREARRMIGEHVLTQADVLTTVTKEDSIGIGSFPIDSHDCQRVATPDGGWVNEGTILPVHVPGTNYGQPHQLPYRALLPRRGECDNLLVPVCLSASHVAMSSVRVEPTWMVIGHAAGVAAAMAVEVRSSAHDVRVEELQKRLRDADQVLDIRPEHLPSDARDRRPSQALLAQ